MTPLLLATTLLIQPAQIDALQPGQPLVAVEPGQATKGEVVGIVDVPMDTVLAIVKDCEATPGWFPQLRDTKVVGESLAGELCSGATELPWPMADRTWTIEVGVYEETRDGVAGWVVPFRYVSGGTLEQMYGGYHLQPWGPDGRQTLVTYEAWVDLGTWIPDSLIAMASKRILPGLIGGIEEEAARRQAVAAR